MAKMLSIDEREAVEELLLMPGWEPLMEAVEALITPQERQLLNYDLNDGVEGLAYARSRVEGARRLLKDIRSLKPNFINKQKRA